MFTWRFGIMYYKHLSFWSSFIVKKCSHLFTLSLSICLIQGLHSVRLTFACFWIFHHVFYLILCHLSEKDHVSLYSSPSPRKNNALLRVPLSLWIPFYVASIMNYQLLDVCSAFDFGFKLYLSVNDFFLCSNTPTLFAVSSPSF